MERFLRGLWRLRWCFGVVFVLVLFDRIASWLTTHNHVFEFNILLGVVVTALVVAIIYCIGAFEEL